LTVTRPRDVGCGLVEERRDGRTAVVSLYAFTAVVLVADALDVAPPAACGD